MGFSRAKDQVAVVHDCHLVAQYLLQCCIGKTAVELRNVTATDELLTVIDFAALDSTFNRLTLGNDDFECAELFPNYGRLEHTTVTDLIISSHVVCDVMDKSDIQRMKVYGNATIRSDAFVNSLDVTPLGQVIILGCDVPFLDVSGTAIVLNSSIDTYNLRAGGRLYHHNTKFKCRCNCNRPAITGKIKLDDPFVLNLLAMGEFEYMYG